MCSKSSYNWLNKYKNLTVEDMMEEFRSSKYLKVYISEETGQLITDNNVYMPNHYGITNNTIPCDAIEIEFDAEHYHENEVESALNNMIDKGKSYIEIKDSPKSEIIETDVSCDTIPISGDINIKERSISMKKEFSYLEKLQYAMQNTTSFISMNEILNRAKSASKRNRNYEVNTDLNIKIENSDGTIESTKKVKDIIANNRYLTEDEYKVIENVFNLRKLNYVQSKIYSRYESSIKKAYSQNYLIKIKDSIKNDTKLSDKDKISLNKLINKIDYKICKKTGFKYPTLNRYYRYNSVMGFQPA